MRSSSDRRIALTPTFNDPIRSVIGDGPGYSPGGIGLPERWLAFATFVGLLCAATLARALGAGTLTCTILSAPLYFLVPLGIGLLAVGRRGEPGSRTLHLVFAYFFGLITLISVVVTRERFWSSVASLDLTFAVAMGFAALGFLPGRAMERSHSIGPSLSAAILVLPVFLFGYTVRFVVYSDYPLTDLFQLTHLMKGALELANFDRLNPYTADSYAPAIQSAMGMMTHMFGAGALESVWILSLLSFPLIFACIKEALQPITYNRSQLLVALAVAMAFAPRELLTNGGMAAMGSLAIFGITVRARGNGSWNVFLSGGAGVLGVAGGFLLSRSDIALFLVTLSAFALLYRLAPAPLRLAAMSAALGFALAPLHRGMLLFAPVAVMLAVIVITTRALSPRYLLRLTMGLLAVVGLAGALILSLSLEQTDSAPTLLPVYEQLLTAIFGISASGNPDAMIGAGPKVALFEIVRMLSPSLVLASITLLVLVCLAARREHRSGGSVACASALAPVLPPVIAGITLAGLILTGIPFIHRAGFFLWILGSTAFAYAAMPIDKGDSRRLAISLVLSFIYLLVALRLGYGCTLLQACPDRPYLDMAIPFYGSALAAVAAFTVASLIALRRGWRAAYAISAIGLVSIFALEFAVSRAFFMPYAYGESQSRVVAHLTTHDVELAAYLRENLNEPMLLSDPVTLANMSALTGLNGMVGFSNLDTMQPHVEAALRRWLASTLQPSPEEDARGICTPVEPLELTARHGNAASFNYAIARRDRPDLSGAQVLGHFGYRPALLATWAGSFEPVPPETETDGFPAPLHSWLLKRNSVNREPNGILLVVASRTLAWQRGVDIRELAYGTPLLPLAEDLTKSLARRCNVTFNDGYFVLIRFPL